MTGSGEERLRRELGELFAAVRVGEVSVPDFAERLESLHARFLGKDAEALEMVERRKLAIKAYEHLTAGIERHHNLELIAEALGINVP